jgi:hypothetical protein
MLQGPVVTAQADAAQQELASLFSNTSSPANAPTPMRVQVLVGLISRSTPAAAAAAAGTLSVLSAGYPSITNHFLQQAAALSAIAQLLKGTGQTAQAAMQLLLTLVNQSLDVHFEAQINNAVPLQHIMSHPGILCGLILQLAQGGDSTTAAAAAVVLARWTVSSSSSTEATSAKSGQLAALFMKAPTALGSAADLLVNRGSSVTLADAAAQLLQTVALAGPHAAKMVGYSQRTVARLVGLSMITSQQPPTATPSQAARTIAAACRAATALMTVLNKADAPVRAASKPDGCYCTDGGGTEADRRYSLAGQSNQRSVSCSQCQGRDYLQLSDFTACICKGAAAPADRWSKASAGSMRPGNINSSRQQQC